jgi:NAD(P)H-flavin reductase
VNKITEALENSSHSIDYLPLTVKLYETADALSRRLKQCYDEVLKTEFAVEGPYGRGLGLQADSEGIHYIFAGGQGILPFLDFFDFLLRKIIFETLRAVAGDSVAEGMNWHEEEYEKYFRGSFRVVLFCAFQSKEEFIGDEIVAKLLEACNVRNKGSFECVVRYSDGQNDDRFKLTNDDYDENFVRANVMTTRVEKVYVCGPPRFCSDVYEALRSARIHEHDITMY